MANELKCFVGKMKVASTKKKEINRTVVSHQSVYDKDISLSYGKYAPSTAINFSRCIMLAIPSADSIKKFIPNLTVLYINNSNLSKITSEDLRGYDCLRDLYIENCEIEHLPGELFEHTPNLEIVSFESNKIKYIDEGILAPLHNLKIFSLWKNVNINVYYDVMNHNGDVTLEQLKNEIETKCSRINLKKVCDEQQKEIATFKANDEVQKKENAELKRKYEEISGKFVTLSSEHENFKKICFDQTEVNKNLEKKLETVLQQFQVIKQVSKICTIKINEKNFRVSKAVLIAQSQVLAKLIADNHEVDSLELRDISEATFQEILNFMNDGNPSSENANVVELFEASCRLEIDALTSSVADLLKEEVNQINALDVLVLCNKFDELNHYHELKMKAFTEFQKNFPLTTLIPEFASQPEKLKKLMQAKLEIDEMVAEMLQVD